MSDLLGADAGALFSTSGKARYRLWRSDGPGRRLGWLLMNPSRAGETANDPTVHAIRRYSRSWGYAGDVVMNLVPFVSSHPDEADRMVAQGERRSTPSEIALGDMMRMNEHHLAIVAHEVDAWVLGWGNPGERWPTAIRHALSAITRGAEPRIFCALAVTASGAPQHPLARGVHRVPVGAPLRLYDRETRALGDVWREAES